LGASDDLVGRLAGIAVGAGLVRYQVTERVRLDEFLRWQTAGDAATYQT
jgi:hypothetical protein